MQPNSILEHIREKYRDLDHPEFWFVGESISRQPYQPLVERLEQQFSVQDDTDPNDDVSFIYVLRSGRDAWVLALSMVGPFAALFRATSDHPVLIDATGMSALTKQEAELVEEAQSFGFSFLTKALLEMPIGLTLQNASRENTRLYQALFSDTDILPWDEAVSQ